MAAGRTGCAHLFAVRQKILQLGMNRVIALLQRVKNLKKYYSCGSEYKNFLRIRIRHFKILGLQQIIVIDTGTLIITKTNFLDQEPAK
jgi:hypothetical protein